jgi:hypothetical protein
MIGLARQTGNNRSTLGSSAFWKFLAKHLCLLANQIALREAEAESPLVRRARAYIAGHHEDPVSLGLGRYSTSEELFGELH